MPNWSPTNEELLAFVMNDADPKLKEKLEARLATQPELQAELAEIAFIKSQLHSQAVLLSKPRSAKRPFKRMAWQFSLASAAFALGLFVESKLNLLPITPHEPQTTQHAAHMPTLSWDTTQPVPFM